MATFNLSITAHTRANNDGNEAMWCVWSKDFDHNIMNLSACNNEPVLASLLTLMPCAYWLPDDGDDKPGATYCQYAAYENNNPDTGNYLLGCWTEIDEKTGCMK